MIINLSKSLILKPAEESILNKGLNFIPSIQTSADQKKTLTADLQKHHRRIKLEVFFEGKKRKKKKIRCNSR